MITLRTKLLNFRIRKENGVSNLVYTQITHICNVCTVAVPIAKVLSFFEETASREPYDVYDVRFSFDLLHCFISNVQLAIFRGVFFGGGREGGAGLCLEIIVFQFGFVQSTV